MERFGGVSVALARGGMPPVAPTGFVENIIIRNYNYILQENITKCNFDWVLR